MRKLMKLGALSLLGMVPLWSVEIHSMADAVNLAGKQRMYTQRMLKDYAMVGMGNTFGDPGADLAKTIADFDDHLKSLDAYAKDAKVKAALKKVDDLWKEVKPQLQAKPTAENAAKLQERLEALLHASDEATKAFADASGTHAGKIINIAGKQRMLSQRMASLYMLEVWGLKDPKFKEKLNSALKEFKDALKVLKESPLNNEETKALLAKVERSFMFFEMMNRSKSKFIPTLIYKKSNDMLTNMNKVTQIYVQNESK